MKDNSTLQGNMIIRSYTALLIGLTLLLTRANTSDQLSVNVYGGERECQETEQVKEGDFVSLHYSGYIDESSSTGEKGAKFESSLDGGEPFSFFIGSGNVIPGWEEGLIGLCQGAKVTLIVPPGMAYGTEGAGTIIPGDATLKFDVHIISVDSDKEEINLFELLDRDNNGLLDYDEIDVYFEAVGQKMPEHFMDEEDKNDDGVISWEEFMGPKGKVPPAAAASSAAPSHDEL